MVNKILVLGEPGTGKTSAAESLDPKTTFIICSDKKSLPFRGWKNNYKTVYKDNGKLDLLNTNYYETNNPTTIINLMKAISEQRTDIKVILIDTLTNIMVSSFMDKAKEKGFEKYVDLANDVYMILSTIDNLRSDLTIIVTAHVENSYDAEGVLRTSFMVVGGKLIGEKIKVEGLFTTVLYTEVVMEDKIPHYYFLTQNNGKNTCKSPKGMFTELRIPNDYKLVLQKIIEYEGGDNISINSNL